MAPRSYRPWQGRTPITRVAVAPGAATRPALTASGARDLRRAMQMDAADVAHVVGPDGAPVDLAFTNVAAHVVRYPERWAMVPLFKPIVREAFQVNGRRHGPGKKAYSTRLPIADRGGVRTVPVVTYATETRGGRRKWITSFDLQDSYDRTGVLTETAEQKLARRAQAEGGVLWPRPIGTGVRNPSPAGQHAGRSPSGGATGILPQSTTSAASSVRTPLGKFAALLLGVALLTRIAERSAA